MTPSPSLAPRLVRFTNGPAAPPVAVGTTAVPQRVCKRNAHSYHHDPVASSPCVTRSLNPYRSFLIYIPACLQPHQHCSFFLRHSAGCPFLCRFRGALFKRAQQLASLRLVRWRTERRACLRSSRTSSPSGSYSQPSQRTCAPKCICGCVAPIVGIVAPQPAGICALYIFHWCSRLTACLVAL